MAKVENPVRGYVSCPVCQSVSTVHQCGEGKLIATGETPKTGAISVFCITAVLSVVTAQSVSAGASLLAQIWSRN